MRLKPVQGQTQHQSREEHEVEACGWMISRAHGPAPAQDGKPQPTPACARSRQSIPTFRRCTVATCVWHKPWQLRSHGVCVHTVHIALARSLHIWTTLVNAGKKRQRRPRRSKCASMRSMPVFMIKACACITHETSKNSREGKEEQLTRANFLDNTWSAPPSDVYR